MDTWSLRTQGTPTDHRLQGCPQSPACLQLEALDLGLGHSRRGASMQGLRRLQGHVHCLSIRVASWQTMSRNPASPWALAS